MSERALGFAEEKSRRKTILSQITTGVCEEYEINTQTLAEPGKKRLYAEVRAIAAYLVQKEEHLSLTDLSKAFKRDLSALSGAAGGVRDRLGQDTNLADRVSCLKKKLQEMSIWQA